MTETDWVTASAASPEREPEEVEPTTEELLLNTTGPTHPDPTIPAPDLVDQLPRVWRPSRTGGRHWYVSAHGGAGATTLAAADPEGEDSGHAWPSNADGQNVVVVARETVAGLEAACRVAQHWASGSLPDVRLLALVTVPAMPGRPPLEIARLTKVAAGVFPRHYQTDWAPEHMARLPSEVAPTRTDQKVVTRIQKISSKEA